MTDYDDDDGFHSYQEDTVDPGYSLLVATAIFCFASNLLLPCFVSLGRRYQRRRDKQTAETDTTDADEAEDEADEQRNQVFVEAKDERVEVAPDEKRFQRVNGKVPSQTSSLSSLSSSYPIPLELTEGIKIKDQVSYHAKVIMLKSLE